MAGIQDPALIALRKWATLLDSAFQVPGTTLRFGLDPVVGLIPGIGDLVTGLFSLLMVLHGVRLKVPKVVLARMTINIALDMLAGAVPLLGDLFDAGYKANLRNLALLERHANPGVQPQTSDYIVVALCILAVLLMATLPILIAIWVFSAIDQLTAVPL